MSYRRSLLTQWSRRDRLTVVVVAVTTAFLVGTALLLLTAGAYTTTIGDDLTVSTTVSEYDSYEEAETEAPESAFVFPVTTVTDGDGNEHRVVGVPPDAPPTVADASVPWDEANLPTPTADRSVQGPVSQPTRQRLAGPDGATTVTIHPHATNGSLFPPSWYAANATAVRDLGPTGALVVSSDGGSGGPSGQVPATGTPIVSALLFLLAGLNQVLRLLVLAAAGGAVLVLVVIYNVTRMSVRERLQTIKVVRSTGASPRTVLALFGLRAGSLALVGVVLGYALGIVVTSATINAAIYAGFPISMDVAVTSEVLQVVLPLLVSLVSVGVLAGVLAARPATTCPPSTLGRSNENDKPRRRTRGDDSGIRAAFTPRLLGWRTLVPTATTLTVFALIVVLTASIGGTIAPLTTTDTGTVTEAGAAHPINSRVDVGYASVLRSQGIEASPEIIVTQVKDGRPYMARGANYSAFASVSDARLVQGREPATPGEAVVGSDLAKTLGLEVGDTVTLGGSTSPSVTQVTVVGRFDAPDTLDDQLVVPLDTAHHLSLEPGTVHLITTSGGTLNETPSAGTDDGVAVTGLSTPSPIAENETLNVTVDVRNFESRRESKEIAVRVGGDTHTKRVTLGPNEETSVTLQVPAPAPGERRVSAGSYSENVTVLPADALVIPDGYPERGPPGARLVVLVESVSGEPVRGATVEVGNRTFETDDRGATLVTLPEEEGEYAITATKSDRPEATHRMRVVDGATRQLSSEVEISPEEASVLTRPQVNVTLVNPWAEELTRDVSVVSPTETETQTVTLNATEAVSSEKTLGGASDDRTSPGDYTVQVVSDGETIAQEQYTVVGDDRVFSTMASDAEFSPGTGVGRAIESVFGNIQVLLAAMVVLAGLTTIGSTTATFAQAVHARRRTIGIYRATGADPTWILKTVLLDVCRLSVPAAIIATATTLLLTRALVATDLLTVFGIRVSLVVSPIVVVGIIAGSVLLALVSALIALLPALESAPTRLLTDSNVEPPTTERTSESDVPSTSDRARE
ncbi:FtsX-like permease family protein [Halegenticoccus tardaugens]|uniref:FtsX-like permease family protein n=1 Tax=Halegenticoccus tardaugens TaxID=2071624 RepID=UPI00100BD858|nr:FtsX-like permease family protein [Halegenticoccus tardaugens]